MNRSLYQKVIRFIQIDFDYLKVSMPLMGKIKNILFTDWSIFKNLLINNNVKYRNSYNNLYIESDTPYATKTFLAATYDFYIETQRLSILPPKPIIIDIGANIGQYSIAVKSFFPKAELYSVEPDPNVFKLLMNNTKSLKSITTYNYALASKTGSIDFYVNKEFSEWSSIIKQGYNVNKIRVKAIKGDTLFANLKYIDLLKIDVEGAELEVIRGLVKTLKKSKYLLIELSLSRNKIDPGSSTLLNFLLFNNFYFYSVGRIFSDGIGRNQGAVDIIFKNKLYD